jgi:AcrR family transcriptional regulator
MPRTVDPAERQADIITAALQLLATKGPRALTVRGLAAQLGGSSTLVTHFYRNRNELVRAITAHLEQRYDLELAEMERITDPRAGLHAVMVWLLPATPEEQGIERRRILMSAEADTDEYVSDYLSAMDEKERGALRKHLLHLVPSAEIEGHIDVLRALTHGIILAAVDNPELWTPERQIATINRALSAMGFGSPTPQP